MSRIGRKSIQVPSGVSISQNAQQIVIRGPKGELQVATLPNIEVAIVENEITVARKKEDKQTRAFHGLVRSLLNNAVLGVTQGYRKTLKLIGTGYRVQAKGAGISLAVGFSHPVDFVPSKGVQIQVEGNDTIHIDGIDKQAVGQVAANIRKVRPPEPYKGKGIRYIDETVRRKQGKTAA